MASTRSAGIVLYRGRGDALEVLLVHPGGPFWARKDDGAWSIPKGEIAPDEDPLEVARREFEEETGAPLAAATLLPLPAVRQAGGKVVQAWAAEGNMDAGAITSNTFTMDGPRGRAGWPRFRRSIARHGSTSPPRA